MKFGENFNNLSNKWPSYNLDYSELKHLIRLATTPSGDSKQLSKNFTNLEECFNQQFEIISIFVNSKISELSFKLASYNSFFANHGSDSINNSQLIVNLNNLSCQIIDFSNFIIYQKLALNKLFKKYSKHFKRNFKRDDLAGEEQAQLVNKYKNLNTKLLDGLNSNGKSFLNTSLNKLIFELEIFKSLLTSISTGSDSQTNSIFTINNNLNYDLNCIIKNSYEEKYVFSNESINNLKLFLLNQNISLINDNLSVSTSDNTLISYIYLTNKDNTPSSLIISEKHKKDSIILSPQQKLTRFTYCCLPNSIINRFVLSSGEGIQWDKLRTELKKQNSFNGLTKLTLNYIVENSLKPSYKVIKNRTRFYGKITQSDKFNVYSTNDIFVYINSGVSYTRANLDIEFDSCLQNQSSYNNIDYCELIINHNFYNYKDCKLISEIERLLYLHKINFDTFDYIRYTNNDIRDLRDVQSFRDFAKLNLRKQFELNSIANSSRYTSKIGEPNQLQSILISDYDEVSTPQIDLSQSGYWNEFENSSIKTINTISYQTSLSYSILKKLIHVYLLFSNPSSFNDSYVSRRYSQSRRISYDSTNELHDETLYIEFKKLMTFLKKMIIYQSISSLIFASFALVALASCYQIDTRTMPDLTFTLKLLTSLNLISSFLLSTFSMLLINNIDLFVTLIMDPSIDFGNVIFVDLPPVNDCKFVLNRAENLVVLLNFAFVCFGFSWGFILMFENEL